MGIFGNPKLLCIDASSVQDAKRANKIATALAATKRCPLIRTGETTPSLVAYCTQGVSQINSRKWDEFTIGIASLRSQRKGVWEMRYRKLGDTGLIVSEVAL